MSDERDLDQLRARLDALSRENAALRSELHAQAMPAPRDASARRVSTTASTRRRWVGRVISTALLAAGFGLGVWYAQYASSEFMRGFRRTYNSSSRNAPAAPVAPATPAPPAASASPAGSATPPSPPSP